MDDVLTYAVKLRLEAYKLMDQGMSHAEAFITAYKNCEEERLREHEEHTLKYRLKDDAIAMQKQRDMFYPPLGIVDHYED